MDRPAAKAPVNVCGVEIEGGAEMRELQGNIVDLPMMYGTVSQPKRIGGNIGAETINTGENGATFFPSVSPDGTLSWANDKNLPNPDPVKIKGDPGKNGYTPVKGKDYFDGEPGKPGYTPVKGKDYFDGAPGAPGVSAAHKWNGTVLSITSANGTSSADLKGEKGDPGKTPVKGVDYFDGEPGKPGYTPVKGKDYFDGHTPAKGTDYFTESDKAEMVAAVIAKLPVYDGEVVAV